VAGKVILFSRRSIERERKPWRTSLYLYVKSGAVAYGLPLLSKDLAGEVQDFQLISYKKQYSLKFSIHCYYSDLKLQIMGYFETMCQLCGVSPAISRLRRPDEPFEAAWSYYGEGFTEYGDSCRENSGCMKIEREGGEFEHVAGPGCVCGQGYSGHRILLEEMKGCRALQCLVLKEEG
jgi:hypothetical protein